MAETNYEPTGSIVDELKVDPDGVGRSTIRGVARMVGVSDAALRQAFEIQAFEGAKLVTSKLAGMLIEQGLTAAKLGSLF